MAFYSNNANFAFFYEVHTTIGPIPPGLDGVIAYTNFGSIVYSTALKQVQAARAAKKMVLGYVKIRPAEYEGFAWAPDKFPKGTSEPHVKAARAALKYPNGVVEMPDGWIVDFSEYKMSDGKTNQTPTWNIGLCNHVMKELFAWSAKPVYPLLKPWKKDDVHPGFLDSGGAIANQLNAWERVGWVETAGTFAQDNAIKIPGDMERPQNIPFISNFEWWQYGAQLFDGTNLPVGLFLFYKNAFELANELGVKYTPADPGPVDPPVDPGENDDPVVVPGDLGGKIDLLTDTVKDLTVATNTLTVAIKPFTDHFKS